MITFFVKYPSFLSTTYLLYSSAEINRREQERVLVESSAAKVADITTALAKGREECISAHCEGVLISQANKEITLLESG